MLTYILEGIYLLSGVLLAAALLTDKNANTNKKEAVFCIVAGAVWPLAVGTAAGFALYENVQEKLFIRRQNRAEQVIRFSNKLHKLQLISKDTLLEVRERLSTK